MSGRTYRIVKERRSTRSDTPAPVVSGGSSGAFVPPVTPTVFLQSDFSNVNAESWFFYTA